MIDLLSEKDEKKAEQVENNCFLPTYIHSASKADPLFSDGFSGLSSLDRKKETGKMKERCVFVVRRAGR